MMSSTAEIVHTMEEEKAKKQTDDKKTVEHNKIAQLRASLQRHDPSSKEVDEGTLRRFLAARDWDVGKATTMLLKFLKWRAEFVPNGSISPSQVPNEIAQNKMFMQGCDKQGRPVAILFAARHFQNKDPDEFKRFVVCVLDKISSSIPEGHEKFTAIADLQGWSYANCDIRAFIAALGILQVPEIYVAADVVKLTKGREWLTLRWLPDDTSDDVPDFYPERLGKCFIVHAPYIFMAAWKIIYPFIDMNTRKKIVFVDDKKLKSTLLEDIDESQIPNIYGGQMQLVPVVQL